MKRKLTTIEQRAKVLVEYGCVEKISGTEWRVKSQTDTGVRYRITSEDGWRCTCPYTGMGWCKHVLGVKFLEAGVFKPLYDRKPPKPKYTSRGGGKKNRLAALKATVEKGDSLIAPAAKLMLDVLSGQFLVGKSLSKSALQKNIRFRRQEAAVRCALALAAHDFNDLARRLPIILVEDVLVCPWFASLIGVMERAASKEPATVEDLLLLLTTVWVSCDVAWRDLIRQEDYSWSAPIGLETLPTWGRNLINGIMTRKRFGGMKDDQKMLIGAARLWAERLRDDPDGWKAKLENRWAGGFNEPIELLAVETVAQLGSLKQADIPLAAVDGHCSPQVKLLAKKESVQRAVQTVYGNDVAQKYQGVADVVNWATWYAWCSVNDRVDVRKGIPFSFIDEAGEVEKARAEKLLSLILPEAESIAKWFIRKQSGK